MDTGELVDAAWEEGKSEGRQEAFEEVRALVEGRMSELEGFMEESIASQRNNLNERLLEAAAFKFKLDAKLSEKGEG